MEEWQSSCEYYEKGTEWGAKEDKATTQKRIKKTREKENEAEHEQEIQKRQRGKKLLGE